VAHVEAPGDLDQFFVNHFLQFLKRDSGEKKKILATPLRD
jgi:hypothetical protein